jgi:hypothetical protein
MRTATVLVADDERKIRDAVRLFLERGLCPLVRR